jgi:small-conductance mechanosensitive channel
LCLVNFIEEKQENMDHAEAKDKKVQVKYLGINAVITVVVGAAAYLILKYALPSFSFPGIIWLTLCFFIVCQLGMNILVSRSKAKPRQMPQIYLLLKMIKFILLVIFAVAYCVSIKHQFAAGSDSFIKPFLVTFAIYYIIWLVFDTTFFMKHSKDLTAEVKVVAQKDEEHDKMREEMEKQEIAEKKEKKIKNGAECSDKEESEKNA